MNSPWTILLWAEWRQRRTQFFVCLGWMMLGAAYSITHELIVRFRAPVASFHGTALLFGMFVPIFLAMRTSLGEMTDRTKGFNDGLPISPRRRAWVRVLGGAAVFVVPIVMSAIVFSICLAIGLIEQAQERPPGELAVFMRLPDRPSVDAATAIAMVWEVAAVAACSGMMLYLLLSIIGTAIRAESHLGFAGAAVAALWFLCSDLQPMLESAGYHEIAKWIVAVAPTSLIMNYSYGTEKGMYGDLAFSKMIAVPLLLNVVVQCGLAAIFVRRYCRRLSRRGLDKTARALPTVWRPWTVRLPSRTLAIAWLTLRQAVPMCLPGLAIAFLMAPVQMDVADWHAPTSYARKVTDILPSSMWVVGLMWAVVVGPGIFAAELDRHVAEFWRAWPSSTWRLFVVKFFIGLAAVLLVLDGTTIALSWNSPNWGSYYFMNWPYIGVIVPFHATMFAVAVAWTCVLRRPVLGGMAAFATFTLWMIATDWSPALSRLNPIEVYNELNDMGPLETHGPLDFSAHGYPLIAVLMAAIIAASVLIGWRCLRSYAPHRVLA